MRNTNTGGPAFPIPLQSGQSWQGMAPCDGMTLRDYFAAKAMQAIIGTERAQEFVDEDGYEMNYEEGSGGTLFIHTKFLPEEAYMIADAMLKARDA